MNTKDRKAKERKEGREEKEGKGDGMRNISGKI